jgi:hypothetical protein
MQQYPAVVFLAQKASLGRKVNRIAARQSALNTFHLAWIGAAAH